MPEALQTIQTFVAPVVVISANGLLCLALYNRMAAVIGRSRTIHRERFDLTARISASIGRGEGSIETAHLQKRIHMLDEIGHQLLDQIGLLRDSLLRLWAAVLCMLACSLALGLSSLFSELGWAARPNPSPAMPLLNWFAMLSFILGILVMMAGILKAMRELRVALSPVAFEHDMIEASHAENGDGEH